MRIREAALTRTRLVDFGTRETLRVAGKISTTGVFARPWVSSAAGLSPVNCRAWRPEASPVHSSA
jgi:hypothetical protein